MDEIKLEKIENIFRERCKCCLGEGPLRQLWAEPCGDGRSEVYGDMLAECFDFIPCISVEQRDPQERICEWCTVRLREALEFRREVLACEQLRQEHLASAAAQKMDIIKSEVSDNECTAQPDHPDQHSEGSEGPDGQFADVQYLELDEDYVSEDEGEMDESLLHGAKESVKGTTDFEEEYPELEKPEPEKLKRRARGAEGDDESNSSRAKRGAVRGARGARGWVYKQYTRAELAAAVRGVRRGELSRAQACRRYRVPRKTLHAKLRAAADAEDAAKEVEGVEEAGGKSGAERHARLVRELQQLLEHTNAVPFKTRAGRYFCAYCSTAGPRFEEPEELRAHTLSAHAAERSRGLELALRPAWLHEVVKLDVQALHCGPCAAPLPAWPAALAHLRAHGLQLDEVRTRAIPYVLSPAPACALCRRPFPSFHQLDGHMNSHYASYVCQQCGDTFLSAARLGKHEKVHRVGRHPCGVCGKQFTLDKYRRTHVELVHMRERSFKCAYCGERFLGSLERHRHTVQVHGERVPDTTCERCGRRFRYRRYYLAHMRRRHPLDTPA